MRIVVHGQQAFGKAVLEALIKRGENVVAVYVAPEKPGQKADPLKEAALAANLPIYQPDSYRKPEIAEQFQRIDPRFHLTGFVAEKSCARARKRQEFPRTNRPRQFERVLRRRRDLRHRRGGKKRERRKN